jgi:hypothetical protein
MRLLLHSFTAALAAAFFSAPAPAVAADGTDACALPPSAADRYAAVAAQAAAARPGQQLTVAVDLANSPGFSIDAAGELRYRMAFNNVAEGWSWQPQARPESEDYYRWKFLPLQSVEESRGEYVQEEKIGEPQRTRVEWRYDYFLAFDNLYDFYTRVVDDEAGFAAQLPQAEKGDAGRGGAARADRADPATLRLLAVATLVEPALAESTTYWKAIYSRPVDFTLKKRYLVARLDRLIVCDGASGRELARIVPLAGAVQR